MKIVLDFVMPKSNLDYWIPKLTRNKKRDENNIKQLTDMGWNVIVIWECELKKSAFQDKMEQVIHEICSRQ